MTPEEIVEVVGLLATAHGRNATPEMFEVYEAALTDLDIPDARAFAIRYVRTAKWWPSPAHLREAILDAYGLIAPDEDVAWRAALEAVAHGGTDRLAWPIQEALRAVGGPWGFRMGTETTVRAQFRDAYRLAKRREDQEAMAQNWKGLPLNPGRLVELGHGRDSDLDPGGGRA